MYAASAALVGFTVGDAASFGATTGRSTKKPMRATATTPIARMAAPAASCIRRRGDPGNTSVSRLVDSAIVSSSWEIVPHAREVSQSRNLASR